MTMQANSPVSSQEVGLRLSLLERGIDRMWTSAGDVKKSFVVGQGVPANPVAE
jgi:hypothetical protein